MSDVFKHTYEDILNSKGRLIYTNVGTSMLPLLRQKRDLMIIDRKSVGRCKKYDAVLYKRTNGQYVLHRILKVRKNDYIICGDNCYHKEYGITDNQILGVLTAVVRDGKTVYTNNPGYLLYVHLWCDFFCIRACILALKQLFRPFIAKLKKEEQS